jgi:hypothetical protein
MAEAGYQVNREFVPFQLAKHNMATIAAGCPDHVLLAARIDDARNDIVNVGDLRQLVLHIIQ